MHTSRFAFHAIQLTGLKVNKIVFVVRENKIYQTKTVSPLRLSKAVRSEAAVGVCLQAVQADWRGGWCDGGALTDHVARPGTQTIIPTTVVRRVHQRTTFTFKTTGFSWIPVKEATFFASLTRLHPLVIFSPISAANPDIATCNFTDHLPDKLMLCE